MDLRTNGTDRDRRRSLVAALALAAAAQGARAQVAFPARPVRIVVPFPPGALTDALARQLAGRLAERWQQSVVVENRPGAAGVIGMEHVYRSPPDGHTLLFTPQQPLVLARLQNPQLAFDPEGLAPIGIVTRSSVLLLASNRLPVDNLRQLIAHGLAHPGRLNFANTGAGSTARLSNNLFLHLSRIEAVNVPYQGIAPALSALVAGEVDVLFDAMANALPHVRSGRVRVLAVAGERRSPALPEVPTVAEVLPGFASTLWTALAAPPGTPTVIVQQIAADMQAALQHPEFQARFSGSPGLEPVGSTPAGMRQALQEERRRWSAVVQATGGQRD